MLDELQVETVIEEVPVAEQVEEVEETETVEGEKTDAEAETTEDANAADDEAEANGKDDGEHKKTANDRIRELVERSKKAEEALNDLKTKFEAEQKQKELAQKPFYELDMGRIESDIAAMYDQIDELRLEGKTLDAANIQRKITKLLDAVDQNESAKKTWMQEQETKSKEEVKVQSRLKEIDEAAQFYQKQMQIPEDVWEAGGNWLKIQLETKPVLGKKFADLVDRQGAVAGIEWAHQYIVENMGKEAQEAKEKKEEAKKKNIGGQGAVAAPSKPLNSFDDLMALSGKEIAALEKNNPKLFNKLINDKLNRR